MRQNILNIINKGPIKHKDPNWCYFARDDQKEEEKLNRANNPKNDCRLDIANFEKFMMMLDDCDDVQNVYHNAELPEEE